MLFSDNSISFRRISSIVMPLLLLAVYLIASYYIKDVFPSKSQLDSSFDRLFSKYGYEIVFFGGFFESAILVNFLIPGGSVVLAGAYLASRGIVSYPLLILASEAGFSLGFCLDYLLGYFGISDLLIKFGASESISLSQKRIKKWGIAAFFISYANHNLASIFAVTAGVIKMSPKKFFIYNVLVDLFWLLFYTGLVFLFGQQLQKVFSSNTLIILLAFPILFWWLKLVKLI